MYPLGSNMNSLEWRLLQSQVANVSSGKSYILKWRMLQSRVANVFFGEQNEQSRETK